MKTKDLIGFLILSIILLGELLNITSCKTDECFPPEIITAPVSDIGYRTAKCGGNVISDGGTTIINRGICWSENSEPTVTDSITTDGVGIGSFTSLIGGLSPNKKYYIRAYATNKAGTNYGMTFSFVTLQLTTPIITTTPVSSVTINSAVFGGIIISNGGEEISNNGVCWSINSLPTTSASHTDDGIGTGSFTSILTGLTEATTYYLRAYASNSIGTSYGNQEILQTLLTDIDGNLYKTVLIGEQVWMAENLKTTRYNDGTTIPLVTDSLEWYNLVTPLTYVKAEPGFCLYNNDIDKYQNTYGALYNCFVVRKSKVCPIGWHVRQILNG
jgi:hypothetical protein